MSESNKKPVPLIYSGDMGGDDAWAILLTLAHPEAFNVLGICSLYGNTDLEKATNNVTSLLSYTGFEHIPVFAGSRGPLYGHNMLGDDAYGDDGIGGVVLKGGPEKKSESTFAPDWIADTLLAAKEKITIFATGPMTDIAAALLRAPEASAKIERIVLMGGGLAPGPKPNVEGRSGNITIHSEFNFFQDPYAVNIVANMGVPMVLLTMDSNQHIDLNPEVRERFRSVRTDVIGDYAVRMLDPAAALDVPKYGAGGAFIHDPNVIVYALVPTCYTGKRGFIAVEEHSEEPGVEFTEKRHGKLSFTEDPNGHVTVMTGMTDPARVLDIMHDGLEKIGDRIARLDRTPRIVTAPEFKRS